MRNSHLDADTSVVGIYIIINPTGKKYIGQSTNINKRIHCYSKLWCKDQPALYSSFIKYGFENHKIEILAKCSISDLNKLEREFIEEYQSNNPKLGLNLTSGGQDYFKHSKATRLKMSEAQRGNTKTLGRKATPEEIKKRVSKLKGKIRTKDQRKRISDSLKGIKFTPERLRNMSIAAQGINAKKVIDTVTGKEYSSVTQAAIDLGMKKGTLTAMLNGQNRNKTSLIFQ